MRLPTLMLSALLLCSACGSDGGIRPSTRCQISDCSRSNGGRCCVSVSGTDCRELDFEHVRLAYQVCLTSPSTAAVHRSGPSL